MATMIKLLRGSSLDHLERVINDYFAEAVKDTRIEVDLVGGITCDTEGTYVAVVRINAPHKRSFIEGDTNERL